MIKVLHLISGGDVGGAKTHVLTLAKELSKHIKIKMICFLEGEFYYDAKKMGIDIDLLIQNKRYDLSILQKLKDIIVDGDFDIVHCHGARANFICRFLKRSISTPCITTIHSDFMLDFKGNLYKYIIFTKLNIFSLKKFDYFIAVSEDFRSMLIKRNFPKDKIFTVYNGIDFNEDISFLPKNDFTRTNSLNFDDKAILVGILARLHPVKGHRILLEAAKMVLKEYNNVHFLIAGDGDEKEGLIEYVKSNNMQENVHFIGYVQNPYDFLNAIDINVLTSYSESFPYVLLEGAKLKKATIASAVGGIPMLIKDSKNGYLFKSGNSEELANKLKAFIIDTGLRERMGTELYNYASANYSLSNLASSHIEIYKKLLKK